MKALIIYDSSFGNTEQIAQAIGNALASQEDVKILRVSDVEPEQLTGLKLLLVGSPTQGFRPTEAIRNFLGSIPMNGLRSVKVAAFDTRISIDDLESPILRFLARLLPLRYAAKPISSVLEEKGGELVIPPEGFLVKGTEGPLKEGELERASDWAKQIMVMATR
jgi:flavodoxin I